MPDQFTLYDRLGVSKNATFEEIKLAYRANVAKYHPDVNKAPNSQVIMSMLNAAWDTLKDPARRAEYDRSIGSDPRNNKRPPFSESYGQGQRSDDDRRRKTADDNARRKAAEAAQQKAAEDEQRRRREAEEKQRNEEFELHRRKVTENARRERQRFATVALVVPLALALLVIVIQGKGEIHAVPVQPTTASRVAVDSSVVATGAHSVHTSQIEPNTKNPPGHRAVVSTTITLTPRGLLDRPPRLKVGATAATRVLTPAPRSHAPTTIPPDNPGQSVGEPGCGSFAITRVNADGSVVEVSNGKLYTVSDQGIMRNFVQSWSTGDKVILCVSGTAASIENNTNNEKVQAEYQGSTTAKQVVCDNDTIAQVTDDGATVIVSKGRSYTVSDQGIMRNFVQSWSTGDRIVLCTSGTAASIENNANNQKVQAEYNGSATATQVLCNNDTIVRVADDGATVTVSRGRSYTISDQGIMRNFVQSWSTGDKVILCTSGTAASIENDTNNEKVQATLNQ